MIAHVRHIFIKVHSPRNVCLIKTFLFVEVGLHLCMLKDKFKEVLSSLVVGDQMRSMDVDDESRVLCICV
jgi:hypothetical protein